MLTAAAVIAPVAIIVNQAPPLSSSTIVLLVLLAVQTALAIVNRSIESAWLRRCRMDGHGLRRTLIVMGTGAEVILRQLHRHPGDGFLVVGYLSATTSRSGSRLSSHCWPVIATSPTKAWAYRCAYCGS